MKLVLMHDGCPDDLPGHIGRLPNIESMPFTCLVNALWSMIMGRAARDNLVEACGKVGEEKEQG